MGVGLEVGVMFGWKKCGSIFFFDKSGGSRGSIRDILYLILRRYFCVSFCVSNKDGLIYEIK